MLRLTRQTVNKHEFNEITNRLLDLAKHRNSIISYEALLETLTGLRINNDKELAKIFDYFLGKTKLTQKQYRNLYDTVYNSHRNSETSAIIKYYLGNLTKIN